ncbi:MAG: fucose isomerase [Thermoflexales bacterium]
MKKAYLVASGDLRLSANQQCWPAQEDMERRIIDAFKREGVTVARAHAYDHELKHGFIWNQRQGMDVFKAIPRDAPLIVAEAVWQFSYHVLAGLRDHSGPILTVANWSGQWPGLVGLLNLNGSLTKMGVKYSSLWSEDFTDAFFRDGLRRWIKTGIVRHLARHVRDLDVSLLPSRDAKLGEKLGRELMRDKAILGIFDEGCMGMHNAIIDDELMNPAGIYKERLSQSALVAEMGKATDAEAAAARAWLDQRGVTFRTGADEATELTGGQILAQLKMYIAAVRIADRFSCDAVGIQYQLGLNDMTPASDLAEGLLNNVERPPVARAGTATVIRPNQAIPHFNEVDEGSAIDAVVTNRVWRALGFDPATTLHDLRYGERYQGGGIDEFVWVFLISGAAPASHYIGGYAGAICERQPPMYFRLGGAAFKGVSKPGEIVWSRVYVSGGKLHADIGRGSVVALPEEETRRRWEMTTPQWPIMHAVLHGVTRDQMMARHKSNHIQVAYAPDAKRADRALAAKAAMLSTMGIRTHLCGAAK